MSERLLRGHRILVVEDCLSNANAFTGMLREFGAEVVGPALTLEAAMKLAREANVSAALLDVRLDDDDPRVRVWPVATALALKGIPFFFCTNNPSDVDPAAWSGRPVIKKSELNLRKLAPLIRDTLIDLILGQSASVRQSARP